MGLSPRKNERAGPTQFKLQAKHTNTPPKKEVEDPKDKRDEDHHAIESCDLSEDESTTQQDKESKSDREFHSLGSQIERAF
mmetsp:Transcript_29529/g.44936  ORF Transcript_29529/g.44936 Transcript_29529/m.44936 type:complete len:81 (+) Transcript_29529:528-770(+)|eukprot:CAMPEP_0170486816 /NCGR_PEP_ID=MMETSP0208-20121228/5747_1 /TAXON_ID=197538 /ORGANISM="Strombidium inclinatum, Strain S3" /LENGTH=80 /DNA_ID=CAMNT_0010760877 /DNA_START=429 /DNA_END=671 /DNA_ORIENTATION=+